MNPLTYCMNVHPGEDLAAVDKALADVTLPLRDALGGDCRFPIGLRFGSQAAKELRVPESVRRLTAFMRRNRLGAIGVNGFPYGPFHGQPIKTSVYEPDWENPHRAAYTRDLFYALTHLPAADLGNDHRLSVTTVPLAYNRGQGISDAMLTNLCGMALFLRKLEGFTGLRMCLALEPEPDCLLEDTRTTIDFFERLWQCPDWNPAYRDLIGVCFDACHFALGYEDPLNALRSIVSANIPVARIQASAALELTQYATVEDLAPFLDATYLHQTRRREDDASLTCFPDLTRENEGHWYYQIEVSPVLFAALMDQALNDAAVELHYHTMPAALHAEDDDVPCLENVCIIGAPGEDISAFVTAAPAEEVMTAMRSG